MQARVPNKTATTNNIPSDAPPTPPYNNSNNKRLGPLTENTGSIEGNQGQSFAE